MIIDVVDTYDKSLLNQEVAAIRAQGREPIVLNHTTTNAIAQIAQMIIDRAGGPSTITLLRFHGHGVPGAMGVNSGEEDFDSYGNGISITNLELIRSDLARLRPYFAANARVELHGCNVASGRRGRQLLRSLAAIWGVPVSAGSRTQQGGGAATFRFEGPVYTSSPAGRIERRVSSTSSPSCH
jgi:hypothetical protein